MLEKIKKGRDLDSLILLTDATGMNAFMHAAESQSYFTVEYLLNRMTNKLALFNQVNNDQHTTLDLLGPEKCNALIEFLEKENTTMNSSDDENPAVMGDGVGILSLLKNQIILFDKNNQNN